MPFFYSPLFINIVIGLIVIIGSFIFFGKTYGWFKEGGFVYNWIHNSKFVRSFEEDDDDDDDE